MSEQPSDVGVPATVTSDGEKVTVVTPDGMGVAETGGGHVSQGSGGSDGRPERSNPADLVEEPAKVMRVGSMIKQLLDEVRSAPLDEAGRARLADIHDKAVRELKDGLAPELDDELDRLVAPFQTGQEPSEGELRIAQAQLVGWLEGLFHGIQTALVAQQMAAQAQLQEMRRALPPGALPGPGQPAPVPQAPGEGTSGPTGQYL